MNYTLFGGRITPNQIVTYNDDIGEIVAGTTAASIPLWAAVDRSLLVRGQGYLVVRSWEDPPTEGRGRGASFLELEGFEGIRWPINMFSRGGTLARPAPDAVDAAGTVWDLDVLERLEMAVGPDLTATEVAARVGGRNPRQVPFNPWERMIQDRPDQDPRGDLERMRAHIIPPRAIALGFDLPKKESEPALKYGVDYS